MSGARPAAMSVEEAITRLAELRKYIEAIQAQIDQATAELEEIRSSTNVITELRKGNVKEFLAPTDRRGHVLLRVSVLSNDRVITHVGLEYFTEVKLEKAIEILTIKEKEVRNALRKMQEELNRVTAIYKQLQDAVNAALSKARAGKEASTGK